MLSRQPDQPAVPARAPLTRRLTRGWPAMLLGSLALAGISLLVLPRSVAYDPWSWLIWGREITHLDLNTRNAATAVKPLAIFINTLFAPTGSAAPVLWLVVARAAALLSIALAFRLGRRLGGVGAGLVAAVGLAVSDEYLGYLFMRGMSEPMATAAVLAAVDNHMQSRRRWALACLIAAGLLRPEAWPFLFVYSLWLAYRLSAWRRAAALVVGVGVPASWFVIDWFGSRQLSRSAGAATHQSQGGPLLTRQPGIATVRETWHLMSPPVIVAFVVGFGTALVLWRRRGGWPGAEVWFGLGAISWLVVDAVLAQGRFATGAPRYLLPGVGLACVVAGVFVADAVRAIIRRQPHSRASMVGVGIVCVGVAAAFGPRLDTTGRQVHSGALIGQRFDRIQSGLQHIVDRAGGRAVVIRCGPVVTQNFQVPLVAWQLQVAVGSIGITPPAAGTVLQQSGRPAIPATVASNYRVVGTAGSGSSRWVLLSTCQQ